MVMDAMNSNTRCHYGWLIGAALVSATVTAVAILRKLQERRAQPEYRAERAYQRGVKQVQTVEECIPRWLAERS
ncbi:MAG: hypothetical protein KatS3mg019_1424 [Fimbriimonadales bacterium]|nr:MAG: hypothetical protein KatS3mg019_1424 [Fimbriimonadales bacterium]